MDGLGSWRAGLIRVPRCQGTSTRAREGENKKLESTLSACVAGAQCGVLHAGALCAVWLRHWLAFSAIRHLPTFLLHGVYLLLQLQGAHSVGECFSRWPLWPGSLFPRGAVE